MSPKSASCLPHYTQYSTPGYKNVTIDALTLVDFVNIRFDKRSEQIAVNGSPGTGLVNVCSGEVIALQVSSGYANYTSVTWCGLHACVTCVTCVFLCVSVCHVFGECHKEVWSFARWHRSGSCLDCRTPPPVSPSFSFYPNANKTFSFVAGTLVV